MTGIGHIILNVSNFKVSEEFYDGILFRIGFESDFEEEGPQWSGKSYRFGEHNIWIKADATHDSLPFVRYVGLDHVAFIVDSKEIVDELFAVVQEASATITRTPKYYPEYTPTYYAFYFRDPDGIPIEIYCA